MKRLLTNIQIWQKLVILGAISLVLCAVPSTLYIIAANHEIAATHNEIRGLSPSRAALKVAHQLQAHRAHAAATLSGNQNLAKARLGIEKKITDSVAALRSTLPEDSESIINAADKAAAEWKALTKAVSDASFPINESHVQHSQLVMNYLRLLESIASYYGLLIDPDVDSQSVVNAMLNELPALSETVSKINSLGTTILNLRQATSDERVNISSLLGRARERLENVHVQLKRGFEANPQLKATLESSMVAMENHTRSFLAVTDLEFVKIEVLRYDSLEYAKQAQQAIDAQQLLITAGLKEVDELLDARARSRTRTMAGLLGIVAALALLATVLSFAIVRSIKEPLEAGIKDAEAIAGGRLNSEILNIGLDEVGRLRRAMRHMQKNLVHVVVEIRDSSASLAEAAHQIA
jgi:HAMP domain-containing protein